MMTRTFFFNMVAVVVFLIGIFIFFRYIHSTSPLSPIVSRETQLSAASVSQSTSTASTIAASTSVTTTPIIQSVPVAEKLRNKGIIPVSTTTDDEIARIQNPYSTPPETFDQINTDARDALVNILCQPDGTSSLDPVSGSGVIIDPRGIILTNAHVAQYVLLSESPEVDLSCVIRTGSPAMAQWTATVLYIPSIWVNEHASEILDQHPTGTGEHDYALLYITGTVNGSQLPSQFPYLPFDTRPAIGFPGDQVLLASYPAEFVGGIAAEYDLYAASSITTIKQLLTFGAETPDVLSLGGVIEAQGGSSGGAVVNEWGRLIGLIATTSSGTTTANRDLRAISLNYIDTDLAAQSGSNLNTLLQGDPATETQEFTDSTAPSLIQIYITQIAPEQPSQE
jgi:hypothetical protein